MQNSRSLFRVMAFHFGCMAIALHGVLFIFLQFLLPMMTRHGQFVTVPNLKGISMEEVNTYLTQRNLRFEIVEEGGYVSDYPPMTVLQQHPRGGTHVKEGRKIYLTINTPTPPQVAMPHLIDGSVRNAHVRLKSYDLRLGDIIYVKDVAENAVLEQWYQGKKIAAGTLIPKDSKIDLVVGAGLDSTVTEVPSVVGMLLEEAKTQLLSVGIRVGSIAYETVAEQVSGTVIRQYPDAGQQIRIGQYVDLWLVTQQ